MEVQPPPKEAPIPPSRYPRIPTRTPVKILEEMSDLCVNGDIKKFREVFESRLSIHDPDNFDIRDFWSVMVEAIRQDNAQLSSALPSRFGNERALCFTGCKGQSEECTSSFPSARVGHQSTNERSETPVLG